MGKTEDFSRRPHGVAMSSPLSHLQHPAERSNSVTGRRANAALAGRQRDRESVGRGHGRAEATACADGTGARCRRHRPSVSSVSPEEGRLPTLCGSCRCLSCWPRPAGTCPPVAAGGESLCPACFWSPAVRPTGGSWGKGSCAERGSGACRRPQQWGARNPSAGRAETAGGRLALRGRAPQASCIAFVPSSAAGAGSASP